MMHHYITAHKRLSKTESAIFVFDAILASKGSSFRTYIIFTAAGVVPCSAFKKSPVHHHNADYIFSGPFSQAARALSTVIVFTKWTLPYKQNNP